MERRVFQKVKAVTGELLLPGDKSVSHRAVMFSALADGESTIENCLLSEDVLSTINVFKELGAEITIEEKYVTVSGVGFKGFHKPANKLYAGNSGTTARLMSGILSVQNFSSVITGDSSLSKRPMLRVVEPLREFGTDISASENGTLPVKIFPSEKLNPVNHRLQVASAQVKSALLLAGLHLEETSKIIETTQTRNHTENMLSLPVEENGDEKIISVSKKFYPLPSEYFIPSDISTAAFFIVLALLTKNSELTIRNVLLNKTRSGILKILTRMGANIKTENIKISNNEEYGDLIVKSSELRNVNVEKEIIPNIIDEIPILAVAGVFAEGKFEIRNADELRKKESDRIDALCKNFRKLGLEIEEYDDGFSVYGEITNAAPEFNSFRDHRIAMASAVLAMLLSKGGAVNSFECVSISNPNFIFQLQNII